MDKQVRVQGFTYELIQNERGGWNPEAFRDRYHEVLQRYDYVIGDWGYGQLRLKGMFEDSNRKATFDQKISFLDEYIQEYCNFGCAFFVVKKIGTPPHKVGVTEEDSET